MSVQPHNPDQPSPEVSFINADRVADLAERAYLAPESFDGAEQIALRGDAITWDPNRLKPMGENGPLVVLEIGNKHVLKVYGHKYEGRWQFALTPGRYENDDAENHASVQNIVFIDKAMTFGRDVSNTKKVLGIAGDSAISRNHFTVEPSDDQIRFQDTSTNGTKVTFVEEQQPTLHDAFHNAYRARKLGGIVVPK
jgi:hypothetical protein